MDDMEEEEEEDGRMEAIWWTFKWDPAKSTAVDVPDRSRITDNTEGPRSPFNRRHRNPNPNLGSSLPP